MKQAIGTLMVGVLVVFFVLPGFAESKTGEQVDVQSRIRALEVELAALKELVRQDDPGLKTTGMPDKPELKVGTRVFLDGTRGWDEDGTNMWTAVGGLPNYNVGIGTNTPWVKLEVAGHIRANRGALTNIEVFANCSNNPAWDYAGIALSNGTYFPATRLQVFGPAHSPPHEFHIRHYPNAPIIFTTNNIERVRFAGNGNVGIGTNNPQYLLDINGSMRIMGGIHDGVGFGATNQVLVADGIGGVAWAGSPGGSGDYIWNQDTAAQSPASYWIDGTGKVIQAVPAASDTALVGITYDPGRRGVYGECGDVDGAGVGVTGVGGYFGAASWYAPSAGLVGGVLGTYWGEGVWGLSEAASGGYTGVWGEGRDAGVTGVCGSGNGIALSYWGGAGVSGCSDDVGVFGYGDATAGSYGIYGYTAAADGFGVRGYNSQVNGCGIFGIGDGIAAATYYLGAGVSGCSDVLAVGAYADATAGSRGVYSRSIALDGLGIMTAGNAILPWTFGAGGGIEASGTTRGITGFGDDVAGSIGIYGYGLDSGNGGAGVFGRHAGGFGTAVVGLGNGGASFVTLNNGSGGAFTGDSIGVAGFSWAAAGTRAGGYFDNFNGTNYAYVALDWGLGYKINGSGAVSTIMETRSGAKNLFAPESPEAWFEDIGEGQLRNGSSGKIALDPLFLDCITVNDDHPLKVFVQLLDECNGVYVKRYDDGFEVVELNNGASNAKFCYRVIGSWKGYEDARFPDAPPRLDKTVVRSNEQLERADDGSFIEVERRKEDKIKKAAPRKETVKTDAAGLTMRK